MNPCHKQLNHDTHEFILDSGTVANRNVRSNVINKIKRDPEEKGKHLLIGKGWGRGRREGRGRRGERVGVRGAGGGDEGGRSGSREREGREEGGRSGRSWR